MKHYITFIIIATSFVAILSSCSSSQTLTIQGTPGTVITTPNNEQLAVLDNSGQTQITMKRDIGYYPYLLSLAPGSNTLVPFALDYKNHSRAGGRSLSKGFGYFATVASILSCVAMGVLAIAGEEGTIFAYLGGTSIGGAFLGMALWDGPEPIDQDYDYLKNQTTNNDLIK